MVRNMWLIEGLCSLIYTVYSKNCNYSISDVREQVYRVVKHCKTNQVIFYGTEGEYLTEEKNLFSKVFRNLFYQRKHVPLQIKYCISFRISSLARTSDSRPSSLCFSLVCVSMCLMLEEAKWDILKYKSWATALSNLILRTRIQFASFQYSKEHFSMCFYLPFVFFCSNTSFRFRK